MLEEVNDKQLHTPMTKTFKKFRWYPLESRGARPIKFLILLYAISTFHPGGGTRAPCPPDPPLIKRDFCSETDFLQCVHLTRSTFMRCVILFKNWRARQFFVLFQGNPNTLYAAFYCAHWWINWIFNSLGLHRHFSHVVFLELDNLLELDSFVNKISWKYVQIDLIEFASAITTQIPRLRRRQPVTCVGDNLGEQENPFKYLFKSHICIG